MTYEEFIKLVAAMRNSQKRWFRDKDRNELELAKRLEREVDKQLKQNPQQEKLF